MICEKTSQVKVENYANKNNYTILANTLGALEYVKYEYKDGRSTKFLKWPKGSDAIIITVDNKITKINLSEIKDK